jgi:hypothetical protein
MLFARCAIPLLVLFGAGLPLSSGLAQAVSGAPPTAKAGTVTSVVEQEFRFVTWEGTRGTNIFDPQRGRGTQFYAPLTGAMAATFADGTLWELAAKTGYVWSHSGTPGQEATYDGPTDTLLSAKVTIGGFTYISPFVSVNLNLPTGQSFLPGQQRFVRMDPDLVEIGAYGEGFNVNPAVGFTYAPTATLLLSPSIGYAWRGKFGREGGSLIVTDSGTNTTTGFDLTNERVETDPGSVLQAALSAVTRIGPATVQGSFTYVSQSDVLQDGIPIGRAGAGYVASVRTVYPVTGKFAVDVSGGWRFSEKNRVPKSPPSATLPFGGGDLVEEAKNSNSHVLIGAVQPTWAVADNLTFALNYSFLWRDQNYYDIIEDRFIPGRTKHSVGLLLDYALGKTATITLSGSRFWVHDGAGPVDMSIQTTDLTQTATTNTILPDRDYNGWAGALTAKVQF